MIRNRRIAALLALRALGLVLAGLLIFGVTSLFAETSPDITGRWEFAITSGDTQTQLDEAGQSTFSTYLTQVGPSVRNIKAFTTDFVACDTLGYNNVTVLGTVSPSGAVNVTFNVVLADNTSFEYVFSGTLTVGNPTTISGTYQRSAGGCTQGSLGTNNPDGNFVATYFPDLAGTWAGAFDANDGNGPMAVPATFSVSTNTDKTLTGTIDSPTLTNSNGVACFVGPVTLQPLSEGTSYSSGIVMELYGADGSGTKLWVLGAAVNPDGSTAAVGEDNPTDGTNGTVNDGTNNSYEAWYGISGGPCDGLGGGDAPFQLITKHQSLNKHHPRQPRKQKGHSRR